jgi:hypothetical membrane protein
MEFDSVDKKKVMMVAWVCGILAAVVVLSSVLVAVSKSPQFSWTRNNLSDLGDPTQPNISGNGANSIFNYGLIAGGVLLLVFALGRLVAGGGALQRVGTIVLLLGAIALVGIGVFTEDTDIHMAVAGAFFGLSALSFFLIGAGLILAKSKFGLLTVVMGLLVGIPWALVSVYVGWAIPETLSAGVIFVWVVFEGIRLCVSK